MKLRTTNTKGWYILENNGVEKDVIIDRKSAICSEGFTPEEKRFVLNFIHEESTLE